VSIKLGLSRDDVLLLYVEFGYIFQDQDAVVVWDEIVLSHGRIPATGQMTHCGPFSIDNKSLMHALRDVERL